MKSWVLHLPAEPRMYVRGFLSEATQRLRARPFGLLIMALLFLLIATPSLPACELCRESCVVPARGKPTVVSQASAFNGSVLTMLAGTGLMAGLAGRAMVRAARGSGGERSSGSDAD